MSELTCAEFVELVTAYLERTLPAEVEARFVEHLAACEGCERYLEQFRDTIRRLGSLPPESVPAPMRQRLLTAFREWPRTDGDTHERDSSQGP
jgi:anti-sigma factor RsiW